MSRRIPKNAAEPLYVDIREARPNKLFTEEQRQGVRFLLYNKSVACAECGKKRRSHWTLLAEFRAKSLGFMVMTDSGKVHPPLTPVCSEHPLAIAWPDEAKPETKTPLEAT